jgi:hypothetical protein
LAEEKLEYVAEFVVRVWSVRSKESEDVSQTASRVGFDSSILVKENGIVDQLLTDRREGRSINAILVQVCKLGVEILQLLEQGIRREALSNKLIVKLELLWRCLTTPTSLSHHDVLERGSSWSRQDQDSALTETRLALCAPVVWLRNLIHSKF